MAGRALAAIERRRRTHFRANRADFRDEFDDPADLRLGGPVDGKIGVGPRTQRQKAVPGRALLAFNLPQLLGQEGHEGMQQAVDDIENIGDRRLGFRLQGALLAPLQNRLRQLQMPIAKQVPNEAIRGVGGIVEPEGFDGCAGLRDRLCGFAENPAIERRANCCGFETDHADTAVQFGETRSVPELRGEVPVAFDAAFRELDVPPLRGHRGQREAQRVGAVAIDESSGSITLPFDFDIFGPLLVPDEGVDVDIAKGDFVLEVKPHHHHPRDPEEDDVEAGDEHASRIEAL